MWFAEPNVSLRRLQRPCSTHETGIGSFAPALDEDADVEDPVLLRADELLAVVEQHRAVGRVLDEELGHRARRRTSP